MDLWNYFTTNEGKKITKWKHYFPIYEKHFGPIRNKPIKILEIGILNGGSLEMWRYYFPEATIVGIDIEPNCKQHEQADKNIHVRIGNQVDESFLQSIIDEFGTFDLIIDDGSHQVAHVNKTFQFLFPTLADDGIYFIEDTHAAYWTSHGGSITAEQSINNIAKGLVDSINADHTRGQKEPDYFTENLKCMAVYDSIIVFEKGNIGEKVPMEIGSGATTQTYVPGDGIITIRTH
jgi:hypothetical protein